jgi:hypothetical protein
MIPGTIILGMASFVGVELWGAWGSAVGLSVGELTMTGMYVFRARKVVPLRVGHFSVATLASIGVMVLTLIGCAALPPPAGIVVSLIAYFGALSLFDRDAVADMRAIRSRLL